MKLFKKKCNCISELKTLRSYSGRASTPVYMTKVCPSCKKWKKRHIKQFKTMVVK